MTILVGRPQINYQLETLPIHRQLLPQLEPKLSVFLTESLFKEAINLKAIMRKNLNEKMNTN